MFELYFALQRLVGNVYVHLSEGFRSKVSQHPSLKSFQHAENAPFTAHVFALFWHSCVITITHSHARALCRCAEHFFFPSQLEIPRYHEWFFPLLIKWLQLVSANSKTWVDRVSP